MIIRLNDNKIIINDRDQINWNISQKRRIFHFISEKMTLLKYLKI